VEGDSGVLDRERSQLAEIARSLSDGVRQRGV
jgi:hypothetical protein